jgi:hypothetical protein
MLVGSVLRVVAGSAGDGLDALRFRAGVSVNVRTQSRLDSRLELVNRLERSLVK